MNPYSILGVSTQATDQEIKRAYRILAKRYHPDRRSSESSHEQIVAINLAYDILSDPEKRAQYDRGFSTIYYAPVQEEDPMEVYKREYKRKRREREKKEREDKLARRKAIYRVLWWLHVVVLADLVLLACSDDAQCSIHLLPAQAQRHSLQAGTVEPVCFFDYGDYNI